MKGTSYQLRYRVLNKLGWSDFSSTTSFVAADTPSQTKPVKILSISSSAIELGFDLFVVDNGGLPLTGYILQVKSDLAT